MNILEEIKVFLNQPNSVGALLLTGKWGCGKTFFIENTLAEDNQITDNYVPIRVSLFGATTPKSINDKIKKEYLVKRFPVKSDSKIKMLPSIMKKGTSVLAQAIPLFGALNTALSVDWLDFVEVNDIANKKVVLVIDDLERCNMNIQDIFGCLNEYVETKQIKTIIIADEDIIRSKDIKDEEDSTITHSVMPYDILKEKLICRTVRLVPEYLNIVDSVIAHHKESEKGFKEILFSSKDIVCKAFEASQTNNIRSLKCAIQDFERLYVSVAKFNLDIEIIQHFLAVFLAMIFEYKAGRLEHGHYGFIFADNEMRNKYSNFNSFYILETVREWIITGEWNQIGIDIEVNVLIQKLRKEEPKDILLRSFLMDINDEVLNVGYPMLLNESYEGLLTFDDYIQLIKIRLESRYFNIELPIEADIDKALRGMRLRIEKIKENKIEEPDGHSALGENDFNNVLPTEKDMLKEISLFRTYQQHIKNRNILVEALMKNDTKTIYDCFNKYLQSFDAQLAKTTYDYYNALNNPDRRSFSVEFSKQWISASHLTLTDRESSVNGFKLLKRSIFENSSQENIKKAIDKRFIENIDKLIESYNNYLNNCESDSELNPFDNVVIWNK